MSQRPPARQGRSPPSREVALGPSMPGAIARESPPGLREEARVGPVSRRDQAGAVRVRAEGLGALRRARTCPSTRTRRSSHCSARTSGGDGRTTFRLPDLRGRVPLGAGESRPEQTYALGEAGGQERGGADAMGQTPGARARRPGGSGAATTKKATNAVPAAGGAYAPPPPPPLRAPLLAPRGAARRHDNRQPYLGLTYIIALQGIFRPGAEPRSRFASTLSESRGEAVGSAPTDRRAASAYGHPPSDRARARSRGSSGRSRTAPSTESGRSSSPGRARWPRAVGCRSPGATACSRLGGRLEQSVHQGLRDPASAQLGPDVHAPDLRRLGVEAREAAASDRRAVESCDEERACPGRRSPPAAASRRRPGRRRSGRRSRRSRPSSAPPPPGRRGARARGSAPRP